MSRVGERPWLGPSSAGEAGGEARRNEARRNEARRNEARRNEKKRPGPRAPSVWQRWLPVAHWLARYRWRRALRADLLASLSVAALLIPESMGYATVAGAPIEVCLYAAPLALLAYAAFGGSGLLVVAVSGSTA